jgi:hypothetical protein
MKRSRFVLFLMVVACGGSDGNSPADASSDAVALDAAADAAAPLDCRSPFQLVVAPDAESRARATLASFAPGASLEWSATRGTLTSVAALEQPLACSGDADAYGPLFQLLSAHPDLFQIDPADWRGDAPMPCASISSGANTTLVIRRVHYGPLDMRTDVFHAVLTRVADQVVLTRVGGTYVPRADGDTLARLQGCPALPTAELDAKLRAEPFAYAIFAPPPAPICSPEGPGAYSASAADSLTLSARTEVLWEQASDDDPVLMRRFASATLRVAVGAVTPELERSDANCPADDGSPQVGWIRFFDPVTGAILGDHPNPIDGCIVC